MTDNTDGQTPDEDLPRDAEVEDEVDGAEVEAAEVDGAEVDGAEVEADEVEDVGDPGEVPDTDEVDGTEVEADEVEDVDGLDEVADADADADEEAPEPDAAQPDDAQPDDVVEDPAGDDEADEDLDEDLDDEDLAESEPDAWDDWEVPAAATATGAAVTSTAHAEPDLPPEDEPQDKQTHRIRRAVLGLVAVAAVLYVAGYFLTGTRMPANASIGGVDVGAQSPSEARAAVDKALTPRVDDEIVLTYEKTDFKVKPADAGLAFDLDRTIERAGGNRSWNPRDMVGLFFGDHETAPALDVDNSKLQGVITTIGEKVNREVVEAQITFPESKPTAREPKAGLVVARDDAAEAIRAAYLVSDEPVKVPTAAVEPAVDAEGLAAQMKSFAEPAVSGPVKLTVGDKSVDLPVSAYTPALVVRVRDGRLQPYLDPKKLAKPLTSSTTGIGKKAVDATVRIEDGKPKVIKGKSGVGLQPEEMSTKLLPALSKTGADRKVEIEAQIVEPEFTTADAKALKIKTKISSFMTTFPYAPYRNINQGRAAEILNGTIVKPGKTFSFNDTVGERTTANGFTTGTVINGGVFREELGGGVSQVVTTTYNASFFGGMNDVEHHPHAFYIDRYPVGREATVYYGNLDLRFKNPTKYGVLIRAYVVASTPSSAGQMHVELWSTKVWDVKAGLSARRNFREPGTQYDDTDKCVPQGPIQGFDIDVYRTFYKGGQKVKSETDTARYQAADHVICGKDPDKKKSGN